MIRSFRHKGLKELFETGGTARIVKHRQARIIRQLDALDAATRPPDMNIPGWDYHGLQGKPKRYSVTVTGNWRVTFEWSDDNAIRVDYEDYH